MYEFGWTKNEMAIWQIENDGKIKERSILFGIDSAIYSASLNGSELAFSRSPVKAYGFAPYRIF